MNRSLQGAGEWGEGGEQCLHAVPRLVGAAYGLEHLQYPRALRRFVEAVFHIWAVEQAQWLAGGVLSPLRVGKRR